MYFNQVSINTEKGPISAYLGIPYAEPPVGKKRFQVRNFLILHNLKKNSKQNIT